MRLDKYLKVSRIIKRRTVANEACDSGRVMLNDKVARASAEVKVGDVIEIAFGNKSVKVRITSVQETARKMPKRCLNICKWQLYARLYHKETNLLIYLTVVKYVRRFFAWKKR